MRDNGARKADNKEVKSVKSKLYAAARDAMQKHLLLKSKEGAQDQQHKLVGIIISNKHNFIVDTI